VQPTEIVTRTHVKINGGISGRLSSVEATNTSFDPATQQISTVSVPVSFSPGSSFFDLDVSLNPGDNTLTVVGKDTNGVVQCTASMTVKKISPILFLHGASSNGATWNAVASNLQSSQDLRSA